MASWKNRIEGLTGLTLSTPATDPAPVSARVLDFVVDAVRETRIRLVSASPLDIPLFTKETTTTDTDGVGIESANMIISVTRDNGVANQAIPCTEVPAEMSYKVSDEDSLWYRSKETPCYYRANGKVHIKPNPGANNTGRVTHVANEITQSNGQAIAITSEDFDTDYFPNKYVHLIGWHAASQVLFATLNNVHTQISALSVDVPSIPTFIYDDITMPTLPTYNKRVLTPSFSTVDDYIKDEDVDLATPSIQKVTQEIAEYNAEVKDEQQRVTTELKEYEAEMQKRLKNSELSLTADMNAYQRKLEKYAQDINKFNADVQRWTARYQWYTERYQAILQQYLAFFQGITPGQQQQPQEREERRDGR